MPYKPSRSSGLMFDKYKRQSEKAFNELTEMLPNCNPPKFGDLNRLSRLYYSYWLNENKANRTLGSKKDKSFESCVPDYYLRIFKAYPNETYKPVIQIIKLLEIN